MHPILVGTLRLAEFELPVRVYAAKEDREAATVLLCARCLAPVQYRRWCPACLTYLEPGQVIRGVKQGGSVPSPEEGEDPAVHPERGITITSFLPFSQVDPLYVEKSYFLEPVKPELRVFRVLKKALEVSGLAGLGTSVLRTREAPVALRPWGKTLALHTLTPPPEVRRVSGLNVGAGRVGAKELRLMLGLIQRTPPPAKAWPGFHHAQET